MTQFPVALRRYFSWVTDNALVDQVSAVGITPVACVKIGGRWRFAPVEAAIDDPHRIVWIRTDSIGDNLLAASMLAPIREKWPQAEVTVVCQEHIAELYQNCPHIDKVLTFKKAQLGDASYNSVVCAQLAAIGADLVLNSVFSREPMTDQIALACGARKTVAFAGDTSNMEESVRVANNTKYTYLIPNGADRLSELSRHAVFLDGIGIKARQLAPAAWTTVEDEMYAVEFLSKSGLDSRRTIALFPGAQHAHKVYGHYEEVLQAFPEYSVVVLGGNSEVPSAQRLCDSLCGRAVNAVGRLSLRQVLEVLRRVRIYLGSDSAGAHMACVAGIPNVVLAGGGHAGRFFPYSPFTTAVSLPLECYGCNWLCPYERAYCVQDIDPQLVVAVLRRVLERPPQVPTLVVQEIGLWPDRSGVPRWCRPDCWFAAGAVAIHGNTSEISQASLTDSIAHQD